MYLKINSGNVKEYTLTNAYSKPYIKVSNSILPLTNNGGGVIHCKDNNGNTYRPLEYKSVSNTYYTTAVNSEGLSEVTALTRQSTSGTQYQTRASTSGTSYDTKIVSTNYYMIASGYAKFSNTRVLRTGYNIEKIIIKDPMTIPINSVYCNSRVYLYGNGAAKFTWSWYDSIITTQNGTTVTWTTSGTYSNYDYISLPVETRYATAINGYYATFYLYFGGYDNATRSTATTSPVVNFLVAIKNGRTASYTRTVIADNEYYYTQTWIFSSTPTQATTGTTYLTRSSTSATIYLTRSSTSGYSGKSSSQSSGWE